MLWLTPAVIATLAGTLVIALVYFYLYYQDKEPHIGILAGSWLLYAVRFCFILAIISRGKTPALLFGEQLSVYSSGVLLAWGTLRFLGRGFPLWLWAIAGAGIAWISLAIPRGVSDLWVNLPTFIFLAGVYTLTGVAFLRSTRFSGIGRQLTGWGFIAWGLHKADYPFLRSVPLFAPWGFLLAAVLELLIALGILLAYFQDTRDSSR